MEGFRPNEYYLHRMRQYGVVSDSSTPEGPIDPYAMDRKYWEAVLATPR